jgi:hypothetical protein
VEAEQPGACALEFAGGLWPHGCSSMPVSVGRTCRPSATVISK